MNETYNKDTQKGRKKLSDLNIPPNPNRKFFNCRRTNQNALMDSCFWVLDFHEQKVEKDNKIVSKYVVLCKRDLNDENEKPFKFFTGSSDVKYKLDVAREMGEIPTYVRLVGDGQNFDMI